MPCTFAAINLILTLFFNGDRLPIVSGKRPGSLAAVGPSQPAKKEHQNFKFKSTCNT